MGYGIDSEDQGLVQLAAGELTTLAVPIKPSEGAIVPGQVLEYDGSTHTFKKYTSGASALVYAVAAETITIGSGGGSCIACIGDSEVNFAALDATAQADADILAALLGSGIVPRNQLAG